MGKTKMTTSVKLAKFAKEFGNDSVIVDNGNIFCTACGIMLPLIRFQVRQHLNTAKHGANKALKSKHQTLTTSVSLPESTLLDEFLKDLCRAFISANIPFEKLNHPAMRSFLEKHTHHRLPDESTIRKYYDQMANKIEPISIEHEM